MRSTFLSIGELRDEVGTIPVEIRREVRPAMKQAGARIESDMKRRSSFSQRIPGAITMKVGFGRKTSGITFRVDADAAPHARVLERGNIGRRGSTFRHPVYGNRDVWASQPTRPFFFPAFAKGKDTLIKAVSEAIRKAL